MLIVRLGALGDIVHTIPVAAALRRGFPDARIDWVVGARHREILDLVPVVNRRIAVDDRGLLSAIGELRRSRYDVVLDLQGLFKSALVARSTGAPRVIGFSSAYSRERLARLLYTEAHDPGGGGMYHPNDKSHVVWTNLSLLQRLGLRVSTPEFPIDDVASDVAAAIARDTGGRYAVLNPGAAWPNKRWPADRFSLVAEALWKAHGLRSIALWGPGEEPLAREVAAGAPEAVMAAPPTTIRDLVALFRGAAVLVSGDTGPTHIASAVGTPVVGIYGPTRASRNGPLSPRDVTVSREAICQCHHLRQCRVASMCLLDIDVGEVVDAVERRLASVGRG
jgi:lipopolysaccharide heptosyltransferase I